MIVIAFLGLLAVLVSAETHLESATSEFNIKPNGQPGSGSVTFVCHFAELPPLHLDRLMEKRKSRASSHTLRSEAPMSSGRWSSRRQGPLFLASLVDTRHPTSCSTHFPYRSLTGVFLRLVLWFAGVVSGHSSHQTPDGQTLEKGKDFEVKGSTGRERMSLPLLSYA